MGEESAEVSVEAGHSVEVQEPPLREKEQGEQAYNPPQRMGMEGEADIRIMGMLGVPVEATGPRVHTGRKTATGIPLDLLAVYLERTRLVL